MEMKEAVNQLNLELSDEAQSPAITYTHCCV
jgi:hypothetical protein